MGDTWISYLSDVRGQEVGSVLETGNRAVTETSGDRHESVEVLQSSKFLRRRTADGVEDEKEARFPAARLAVVHHLSHVDELGEDLGPLLSCVSAEDHQLDPLGHAVTHHDRALQGGVFPHRAPHHIAAVVQELANRIAELSHGTALDLKDRAFSVLTEMLQKFLNSR